MDMSLNKLWQVVKDGKAGVLPSMGSQRVGHNWVTEQYISHLIFKKIYGRPQKIEVVLAGKECWGAKGNHSDSYSGVAIFLPQFPHWLLSVHMEVSVWSQVVWGWAVAPAVPEYGNPNQPGCPGYLHSWCSGGRAAQRAVHGFESLFLITCMGKRRCYCSLCWPHLL